MIPVRRACIWCTRKFVPRDEYDLSHYTLLSAGVHICWNCSDLYEDAEMKLHLGKMCVHIDQEAKLSTDNGYQLGITVESWQPSRLPWSKPMGIAKDIYGRLWSVRQNNDLATLKPIGV